MSGPRGKCRICRRDGLVLVSRGRCSTCWRRQEGIVQRGNRNVRLQPGEKAKTNKLRGRLKVPKPKPSAEAVRLYERFLEMREGRAKLNEEYRERLHANDQAERPAVC